MSPQPNQSLLFPVDPTGCAFEVAVKLAPIARDLGASVVMLNVVNLPPGLEADAPMAEGAAMDLLDAESRALMAQLAEVFADEGVRTHTQVCHGDVTECILNESDRISPRMLVLGTHGRQGLKRLLMGSVAESVVRRSTVPVLTVRTQAPDSHPGLSPLSQQAEAESMG